MKRMKEMKARIIAILLVCILVSSQMVHVLASNTYNEPTIVVSDVTAAPGGKAYVTISLEENPGIVSMTLGMTYDTNILTLTEVNDAGVFGGTSHKPELVSPYTLVWVNDTATENFTVTGTIVTLVFAVSDAAEMGAVAPIEITYRKGQYDIYDKDSKQIEFAIDNGSVTVGEPGPNAIDDFTYETSGTEIIITGYVGAPTDVIIGSKYTVNGVEYTVTEIAAEAFVENEDITSVVIPETVKTIGEYAFYDCLSLTSVTVLSEDAEINELALGYYEVSRREDGVVEGFTLKGYAGSTAEEYAKLDEDITFVTLEKQCQHTGGTATCKDKAVCSSCGEPYGELNSANHTGGTEVREAVQATCNTAGYTGDTYCLGCNVKIADGTTVPATEAHVDADGDWESNGTQHFHTCACGTEFDKANHSGGTATCKDKAVCSTCGASYGEKDATNHDGETYLVGQKETSCYEEGYTGDTYCSDCNVKIADGSIIPTSNHSPASVWSTDATHHWHECEITACGNIIDKAEHRGGEATCTNKAICSVCNVTYGNTNASNHKNTEIRDAVTASCNTDGYTGDTWCKDCNTKIADGTTIPATGDHVDADGDWESNGTQHFHTCKCGTEFDKTNHSGGAATCKDKAVCATCGTAYGDTDATNHAGGTYVVGQKEASCYEEGYTGDTYCDGCNVKIIDGSTIPTSNHNPASVWSTDATHHWKDCVTVGCGNIIDKAEHRGGEATCTNKAICSVCNVTYGNTNASNHKNTEIRDAVTASCNTDGYTGDTWCKDCNTKIADGTTISATGDHVDADGEWESNGTQHFHTCKCGTEFDKTNHSGGTATCKDKAVCSACGTSYGEKDATNHVGGTEVRGYVAATCNTAGYTGDTYCLGCSVKISDGTTIPATEEHVDADGEWESNGTQHFHTCACGTEFDKTNHSGGTATCKDKAVCATCGTSYGEKDATNHAGGTYLVGQKEASCYEEGYNGDTYCGGCDVKIADGSVIPTSNHNPASVWSTDATHHWKDCVTVGCGNIIDRAEHSGGEATCTNKAICSVCSAAYGDINPNNHKNTEVRDDVAATCTTDGYTGDTWCKDCNTKIADGKVIPAGHKIDKVPALDATHEMNGHIEHFACSGCSKLFADEAATTEIAPEDIVIAKGEHSYSESYVTDADNHWKACECGSVIEKAAHTFGEWSVVKEATETAKGSKEKACTICGHKVTEEIPAIGVENNGSTDKDSPQTGDMNSLSVWMVLLFVSASCITVFAIYNEKKRQNR